MKHLFTLLFCLLIGNSIHAQQLKYLQKDDVALSIIQAQIDGEDYTVQYLENGAFLAFYKRNEKLYFANAWQKAETQSYGTVTQQEYNEDKDTGTITASYIWHYANTYDEHTGVGLIMLKLTPRPVAVAFELSILTEEAKLLLFKGYVNDSFQF